MGSPDFSVIKLLSMVIISSTATLNNNGCDLSIVKTADRLERPNVAGRIDWVLPRLPKPPAAGHYQGAQPALATGSSGWVQKSKPEQSKYSQLVRFILIGDPPTVHNLEPAQKFSYLY
jgi:hypothetical protein